MNCISCALTYEHDRILADRESEGHIEVYFSFLLLSYVMHRSIQKIVQYVWTFKYV